MNKNNYPLHPGQDHVTKYYVQIPQSEYESLKRENEQLHVFCKAGDTFVCQAWYH